MSKPAAQVRSLKPGERRTFAVAVPDLGGDSMTGTPTVTPTVLGGSGTTSHLTIDNVAVNSATRTVNGTAYAAGLVITGRIAASASAVVGTRYNLELSCATSGSPSQTPMGDVTLQIV